jgi:hypothetical protein
MLQRSNRFQMRVGVFPLSVNLGAEFQNPSPRSRKRPLAFAGTKAYMPAVSFS